MFVGGHYAIVTSSRSFPSHAVLVSLPVSAAPGDERCLELWWSSSAAVLSVQVLRHDGVLVSVAWNQSSAVAKSPSGEHWQQATISLSLEGPFQVGICQPISTDQLLLLIQFVRKVCVNIISSVVLLHGELMMNASSHAHARTHAHSVDCHIFR